MKELLVTQKELDMLKNCVSVAITHREVVQDNLADLGLLMGKLIQTENTNKVSVAVNVEKPRVHTTFPTEQYPYDKHGDVVYSHAPKKAKEGTVASLTETMRGLS